MEQATPSAVRRTTTEVGAGRLIQTDPNDSGTGRIAKVMVSAVQGAPIFAAKCASCHGENGTKGIANAVKPGPARATIDGGKPIAYLLNLNNIIGERDVIDAETLPQVRLPNEGNFIVRFPDRI